MTTRKPSQRYFRALALEPRILLDAAAVNTAADVAAQIDATAEAPGVKATPQNSVITITDSTDSFPPVDLFKDVDVTLATDGQELSGLVINIEGAGANQAMRIDGQTIALVNGATGITDATGYKYNVSVSGNVTTVSLDFGPTRETPTPESVEKLISELQYQVQSTSVASGSLSITLESLNDEGGDTRDLDISATITLDNQIDVAPQIVNGGLLEGRETFRPEDLGIGTEVVYSDDGQYAYVAGNGALTAFAVDASGRLTRLDTLTIEGMNTVTEMVISKDGRSIYLLDTLGPDQQPYHEDFFYVIGVDNGELSLTATVNSGNGGITGGMALSDDGAYLYVGTASNDVAIFSRNASSGELTFLARAAGEGNSNSRHGSIAVSGNNVYVVYSGGDAHVLISYARNSDGTLSKQSSFNTSASGFGAVAYSMTVSQNGQYLYVAHPGDGTVVTYAVGSTEITRVESQTLAGVSSIALSKDGSQLYATTAQGAINVYNIASNGGLSLHGSLATGSAISDIAVSGDGVSLLVTGNSGITRFSSVQTLNIDQPTPFAANLTLKDNNYDALAGGTGNYNGGSFSISASVAGGSFGLAPGNTLLLANGSITRDGSVIASFVTDTDGKLTVSFTADTSSAVANQVLQQITYTSAAGTLAGSVVSLTLQGHDSKQPGNEVVVQLRANNAPQINSGASDSLGSATTETPYTLVLPANLFTDADGDTLTWSVDGLPPGLSFDPVTRTLSGTATLPETATLTVTVTDIHGASATRDVTLQVEQIANRAPEVAATAPTTLPSVTLGTTDYTQALSDLFTDPDSAYTDSTLTWGASGLPSGLSLNSATGLLSGTPTSTGDYRITFTVTDEHNQSASHTLTLRVITAGESANSAPALEAGGSDLIYSNDGALSGYSNYVTSITLSDDGKTLVLVGSGGFGAATLQPSVTGVMTVYSRDTVTGKLTLLQTFVQGASNDGNDSNGIELNGLFGATSAAYSSDGKHLYVVGRTSGSSVAVINVLNVDGDGTLSATGLSVSSSSVDQIKQIVVNDTGTALYAVSDRNLYAYGIDSTTGGLTLLSENRQADGSYTINTSGAAAIDIDDEGTVYVLSDSRLTIYRADANGNLSYAGQMTRTGTPSTTLTYTDSSGNATAIGVLSSTGGLSGSRSLLASDAGHLYIATGVSNFLTVLDYDSTSNTLALVSSQNVNSGQLGANPWGLALSADGSTLYVGGGNSGKLAVYDVNSDGSVSHIRTMDVATRAGRIVVSADGTSIYTAGFYNATGLSQLSASDAVAVPYTEGSSINPAAGLTLTDADYDVLDGGAGNYNGATITLQREGTANNDDRFGLSSGNDLTLVDQEIRLGGVKIADFTEASGKLTLVFTADVSTATANAVLRQITYSNDSNEPEASIRLKLVVQDQYQSGTSSFALVLAVASVNDAPQVTATPSADLSHDAGYSTPVALFNDAQISVVEQGQLVTGLSFSVSGLKDGAAETLQLDGSSIALVAGSGTTSNGHAWTVTLDAASGVATVILSSPAGLSEAAASALITGLTYANSDRSNGTSGERTITLSSVTDNGGTANGGQDTATLSISAMVSVRGDLSPTLGADIGAADLAELISNEYPNPYDGLNGVVQVGNLVYAVRTGSVWDPDTISDVPVSTLYVFQRGQDGTLSLLSSIESNAQNGLLSASGLGISADGSTLYAITDNGIALFGRDSNTGALTAQGLIADDIDLINDVQINGTVAYLSTADGVTLFHRGSDGWSAGVTLSAPGDSAFNDLQLSSDNRYLYAATTGGNTLLSVFPVNPDGSLGTPQAIDGDQAEHFANRLALSADGTTLYVVDGNNLYTLTVGANGTPQITGAPLELEGPTKQLLISDDGALLIVVGESSIALYGRAADGSLSERAQINGVGENDESGMQEGRFDELRGATLSADGTQLYLSGTFKWNDGLLVLDLKPASPTFTENGEAVALLPGGTLADPQLDALANGDGDYNGASIVVSRTGEASPDDVFSFLDGSGLEQRGNSLWLDNTQIASLTNDEGVLSITFAAGVSRADAQQVLRSIAYSNASNDPTADGNKATLSITLNDGEGHDDQQLVDVNLIGVNDPAIVDTTVLSPTFTAEGERVKLFENTRIDTVEAGQSIWFVAITIDNVRPGDVLGVGNGRIALDANAGSGTTETGQQYNILPRNDDGSTTVWIYTTLLPVNEVATLVDSITYGHTGADTSGQRTITLAVEEFVANVGDNDITSTTVAERSVVTFQPATETNEAPTLGALPGSIAYTEQAEPVPLAPNATLNDTQMDRFNNSQGNYDGATLTLTLGEGKSAADILGFKADNDLTLEGDSLQKDGTTIGRVSVADGVMTISFSDAHGVIPTTSDVQNALRQITYANSSDVPPASVEVRITLADQRGLESTEHSIAIEITAVNDAPAINDNPILSLGDLDNLQNLSNIPGLGTPTHSVVSADGTYVYVADGQGNIAQFSRDTATGELSHIATLAGQMNLVQMQAAPDGSGLYVLHSDGGSGAITRFAVGDDGALTRQESITGPNNPVAMSLSDDGKNLYVIDNYMSAITTYSRDSANGALTRQATIEGDSSTSPHLWAPKEVVARAEQVFVVMDNGLIIYQRDANGALTPLASIRSGATDTSGKTVDLSNIQHLAVSADGKTLFVANGWTTRTEGGGWTSEPVVTIRENNPQQIDAFTLDTSTGAFIHMGTINDVPAVESIALSDDGKALFVIRHDGSLAYYSAIALEKMDSSQTGLAGATRISLSADGAVIVTGNSLYVLNAPAIASPTTVVGGDAVALVPAMTLNDPELDAANDYQGASVTISGLAGDRFGLLDNATYSLDGQRILRGGSEVATLEQNGNNAVLRFTAAISQSDATALLRLISYSSETGEVGSHNVSLTLNDGELDSQARSVEVTLLAPNQPPELNDAHSDYVLNDAKAGQAYSIALPADLFRDPEGDNLTWSVAGLPAGLSFNRDTYVISGTTTVMGEHSVVISVRDASGGSVSLQLTLDVSNSAPVVGSAYSLGGTTPGASYSVTLPDNLFSDANDSELTWTISDLPEWLSFDTDTHTLSGTAPDVAGSHSITITATDPHGATVSRTLTLAVALPPVQNTGDSVLPELSTGFQPSASTSAPASFGGPALNAPLFESSEAPASNAAEAPAPLPPTSTVQSLLRSTGSGLADGRGSLSEQLANADGVLTDSGQQSSASSFSFDGTTLRSTVDLNQNVGSRSIELRLPVETIDGASALRVTLANGLPLPSWASFDARTGELRIDRERLQRDGVLRLTLLSRDAEGNEQRTPVEIRAEGSQTRNTSEAPQAPAAQVESLPQRLQQETSSALLSDALDLLDQLSDLAHEPLATTRHSA